MQEIQPDPALETSSPAETAELQEVLTRYVDSRDGYLQAAKLAEETGLSSAFSAIAERREKISVQLANLINREGGEAEIEGSPEAGVHRWWIRLKDKFSTNESAAVISECLRGEQELARTLKNALEDGHLEPEHAAIIREALSEVELAIGAFENVIEER